MKFNLVMSETRGMFISIYIFYVLNDLEEEFITYGIEGIDTGLIKLFILLYADDIVIFSSDAEGLQNGLNLLEIYSKRWKLKVNTEINKSNGFQEGWYITKKFGVYIRKHTIKN